MWAGSVLCALPAQAARVHPAAVEFGIKMKPAPRRGTCGTAERPMRAQGAYYFVRSTITRVDGADRPIHAKSL